MAVKRPPKAKILEALCRRIAEQASQSRRSQEASQAGAVHEESRPENDKDTRALESTYLARGLAHRVVELENDLAALRIFRPPVFDEDTPIAIGALVVVEDECDASVQHYLLVPVAGGLTLVVAGCEVTTLTPDSPLGSALIGRCRDEEFEYRTPRGVRRGEIIDVR